MSKMAKHDSPLGPFTIESAVADDHAALKRLLAKTVPECSPETVWELPWSWTTYRVAKDLSGELVGAVALRCIDDFSTEVRGLAVAANWRGCGVAGALVEDALELAAKMEKEVVCVTRKPAFFEQFGFRDTFPTWLDQKRRSFRDSDDHHRLPRIAMRVCDALSV